MRILIDCSNLKAGGGIQVATSFINDLNKIVSNDSFYVVLSHHMKNNFDRIIFNRNIIFFDLPERAKSKKRISDFLNSIENNYHIEKVFCVFGPSYYKSKVPKIVGYAIPHHIYRESPFFKNLTFWKKIRLFLLQKIHISLFKKNSDILVFETKDAQNRFLNQFGYDKTTYVVSNTLNEIFVEKVVLKKKILNNFKGKKILCLSANYPHKNLQIIPKVVDNLLKMNQKNFKFYVSLNHSNLGFASKYDDYIEYLGKVDLENLPSLYQQIDVVFIPTLLEVFSATYLEAMYMKKPIVASDMSFVHDICDSSALYFFPTDPNDAAGKLLRLFFDQDLRDVLIEKGEKRVQLFGTSMDRTLRYIEIIKS